MRRVILQSCLMTWSLGLCAVCTAGPHDAFMGGPWEVMVRVGLDGDTLHFPIMVTDENKAQPLNQVLPVRQTPVTIRFRQYVPDLGWEVRCLDDPNGGHVAQLSLRGPDRSQIVWLDSKDPAKRVISSPIGGVEIKAWENHETSAALFRTIVKPEVVGVLSAWDQDADVPVESTVMPGTVISLNRSQAQLTVLKYVPNYSVDKDTKAVASLGTEPVNPAILVRADIKGQIFERWVWSRFDGPPHAKIEFPVRVTFACTQLGSRQAGKYQLLTVKGCDPKMLFVRKGQLVLDEVTSETQFGFTNPDYAVTVKQVRCGAHIKTVWLNRTNRLIRPALVATLHSRLIEQEVVLEFNQPYHFKTDSGTLVLVYRRMADSVGQGDQRNEKDGFTA